MKTVRKEEVNMKIKVGLLDVTGTDIPLARKTINQSS